MFQGNQNVQINIVNNNKKKKITSIINLNAPVTTQSYAEHTCSMSKNYWEKKSKDKIDLNSETFNPRRHRK